MASGLLITQRSKVQILPQLPRSEAGSEQGSGLLLVVCARTLSELVGRVHDQHELVTVTVHGRPSAILIAPADLEALEETLAIMRDAATMNRLAESDAELARGEYVSAEELAETMRRRQAP
jgi:antitoxin YefM